MRLYSLAFAFLAASTSAVLAQTAGVAFGGFGYDSSLPVEITADSLDVDQTDGSATFSGNVLIGQGEMRLSAAKVIVEYGESESGQTEIKRLLASGGVTLVSSEEAAEAESAVYSVLDASVTLNGNVLLTQGPAAISGDNLNVNLETGQGTIDGNVRTVLNPSNN